MSRFQVGDRVRMTTGEPLGPDTVVEILEVGACDDGPGCYLGGEFIRFYQGLARVPPTSGGG